ncbi:hypothetical protein Heshes_01320 [Alicyclobacillus hesperidum]|uniref:Putative SAM-dependent methyltransferase n=1 Tax=Alicyclobacillus hesperidum TaxID=89784 RepID=A0A1H2SMD1_9BACL|nr:class I SAM-dependent methyltransferase [Alicyclobacillus hesperidum]GLV12448.1 hypothetical protein Heshes_01320 [Alicyclobacillus hesperidum]SDW32677.1 Putative SAM-dependent methyltransferase [Alicyclobacillus hesperidum]
MGVSDAELMAQAVVTTPRDPAVWQVARATELARIFRLPYVKRGDRSLDELLERFSAVVAVADPARIHMRGASHALFFHPSMAAQRLDRRHRRGEPDRLLRAAGVQPGDVIVDGTLGLASDAIVFADAVGMNGHVVGIEQSALVARLMQAVQHCGCKAYPDAAGLLRRIEVLECDHLTWLRQQPDDSVDVVYFDPMFRQPTANSPSIVPLRQAASPQPLRDEVISEARRVARRVVVVKERPQSGVFEQFGLTPDRPRGQFAYGVWRKYV